MRSTSNGDKVHVVSGPVKRRQVLVRMRSCLWGYQDHKIVMHGTDKL